MALRNISRLLLSTTRITGRRNIAVTTTCNGMFSRKPLAGDDLITGYRAIEKRALEQGEDPFETLDRDQPTVLKGSGSRDDPFLVPSRNDWRIVCVEPGDDRGPPPNFKVTLEEGGRCPLTGRYYKLQKIEGDKWGIDELDLFAH